MKLDLPITMCWPIAYGSSSSIIASESLLSLLPWAGTGIPTPPGSTPKRLASVACAPVPTACTAKISPSAFLTPRNRLIVPIADSGIGIPLVIGPGSPVRTIQVSAPKEWSALSASTPKLLARPAKTSAMVKTSEVPSVETRRRRRRHCRSLRAILHMISPADEIVDGEVPSYSVRSFGNADCA